MSLAQLWEQGNAVTLLLLLIVLLSVLQGARRGAAGSVRHLLELASEGAAAAAALYLAWVGMKALSPALAGWLSERQLEVPADRELSALSQLYYTFVTSLRDFGLMRSAVVFVSLYFVANAVLARLLLPLLDRLAGLRTAKRTQPNLSQLPSMAAGALIGGLTGIGRALLTVAGILVFTSLFPQSPVAGYASQDPLYSKSAKAVIEPLTGDLLSQLPVLADSMEDELGSILKRKYEVLDARIPDDIAAAAQEITAKRSTDEEKAKALYQWVGTRVKYDWEKVRLYEEERVWKEQTPEDTFASRTGVCIDYSRLYAVMARSVGLQVKVVTGLGSDGRGGYGSHAWNEVYLAESDRWVPLDSTWVSSGGNWFNPTDFYSTHIKEA